MAAPSVLTSQRHVKTAATLHVVEVAAEEVVSVIVEVGVEAVADAVDSETEGDEGVEAGEEAAPTEVDSETLRERRRLLSNATMSQSSWSV